MGRSPRSSSAFENHLGERLSLRVRDAQRDPLYSKPLSNFGGFSGKRDRRAAALFSYHFDVHPAHAASPAGSQRLHDRLFRREPSRISFKFIFESLAVFLFVG